MRDRRWAGALNQRLGVAGGGGADGSGNGDPTGAAGAALSGFGFFGRITGFRTALGGGPAG
jgi:hypothetical protein